MTARTHSGMDGPPRDADPVQPLSDVLTASLYALADAGETEAACRFAGRACAILRRSDPAAMRQFSVLLHRLTPRLTWREPPSHGGVRR